MNRIYDLHDQRRKSYKTEFSDFEQVEYEMGRRAVLLFAHLRLRGHSAGDSFVASFGHKLVGHPDASSISGFELESSKEFLKMYREVEKGYTYAEVVSHWRKRDAAAISRPVGLFSFKTDLAKKYHISHDIKEVTALLADVIDRPESNSGEFVSLESHMAKVRAAESEQLDSAKRPRSLQQDGSPVTIFK